MGMLLRRHYEAAETTAEAAPKAEEAPAAKPADEAPSGNASKAEWHAYALKQGYPVEGLEGRTRDELRDLFND
jgi:hypothetical protein